MKNKFILIIVFFFIIFFIANKKVEAETTEICKNDNGNCMKEEACIATLNNIIIGNEKKYGCDEANGNKGFVCCTLKCSSFPSSSGSGNATCVEPDKCEEEVEVLGQRAKTNCKSQNMVCCAKTKNTCLQSTQWGTNCKTAEGKDGWCFFEKCVSGIGGFKDPCGRATKSFCIKDTTNCKENTSGRQCDSNEGLTCCKENSQPKNKCEEIGARCLTKPEFCSQAGGVKKPDYNENDCYCCDLPENECQGQCKECSGSTCTGEEISKLCPSGKSGNSAENTLCSPKITKDSSMPDGFCCAGEKPQPKNQCFINGGKCVSKKEKCDQPLASYHDYCEEDEKCCRQSVAPLAIDYDYENPLNVGSISDWVSNLLAGIQGLVGWLAVIMIFVGGIMYILSGGSQAQATRAKTIITWALVGFGLAVAAPSLLKEIKEIATSGEGAAASLIDDANPMKKIVTNVLSFLLGIIGTLALLGFAIGGIMYLTSMGDKNKTDTAKKMVLYSIIAIAISGAGIIILKSVIKFLEANLGL